MCPSPLALAGFLLLSLATWGAVAGPPAVPTGDWPDQLLVYAIPAPRGIDWRSPRRLALHGLTNGVDLRHLRSKEAIGHVVVEVRSQATGRLERTGMTVRVRPEQLQLVALDRYGLGILGADMMGHLETPEELAPKLARRMRTGRMAYLRVLLAPATSARLLAFLDQYRARGLDDHYGGANRPRFGEGGGCSAFGVAFLELAGVMEPEYQSWRVDFLVPASLYGGPLTGTRVPVSRVLAFDRWATPDEHHVASMFWDPSLMFEWMVATWKAESATPTGRWVPESRRRARGLVVDARQRPTPGDPLWRQDPPGTPHPYGWQESVRRTPRTGAAGRRRLRGPGA